MGFLRKMFFFGQSKVTKVPFILTVLLLASFKPAIAEHVAFQSLRVGVQIGIFVKLPSGVLTPVGDASYTVDTAENWHMIQKPFAPFEDPDGFTDEFRTFWGLFDDSPLPSLDQRVFWPQSDSSEILAREMEIGNLSAVFEVAGSNKCTGPAGGQLPTLQMLCLLRQLKESPDRARAVAIDLDTGDSGTTHRSLLVFDSTQLLGAIADFGNCAASAGSAAVDCPRMPALLVHDEPSLRAVVGSETTVAKEPGQNTRIALQLGLFEATSLLHPIDLVRPYIGDGSQVTPGVASLLFGLSETSDTGGGDTARNAPAPGLGLECPI